MLRSGWGVYESYPLWLEEGDDASWDVGVRGDEFGCEFDFVGGAGSVGGLLRYDV